MPTDKFAFKNALGVAAGDTDYIFALGSPAVEVPDDKSEQRRRFAGVGYTGNVITGHPFWGSVVFDLGLMRVPEKMAILRSHDGDKIVGFSDKYAISNEKGLELEGYLSRATIFGQEVVALSDEGFPWQMSVRISPSRIEELTAGATAVVNGRSITGPAYIFRESVISETSFTPTGWDDRTTATALSRVHIPEDDNMSKELEDKVKALSDENTAFQATITELNTKLADATAKLEAYAKAELDGIKATIKEAYAKAGVELSESSLDTFARLPEDVRTTMLASIGPKEPAGQPANQNLFSEQATGGRNENVTAAQGSGLLSVCDAAAQSFARK